MFGLLITDLMQSRGITSVTTGQNSVFTANAQGAAEDSDFAKELRSQLETKGNVGFSKHALERISERQIDLRDGDTLERLNKAVELAGEKGSNDALVMIGSNAFIVSIKNNKVITTLSADDMQGNIFTNIDSTVIM